MHIFLIYNLNSENLTKQSYEASVISIPTESFLNLRHLKCHCKVGHRNQGNHLNFDPSFLPKKLWLIFISWGWSKNKSKIENWRNLKTQFFWVGHFGFYLFFNFIPIKISQSFLGSKDGSKFWCLPWSLAQNKSCINICNTVYGAAWHGWDSVFMVKVF